MWWSRALLVLVLAALGPAGCGFQPLHARSQQPDGLAAELAGVRVLPIKDRLGQQLRNDLVHRLTPKGEPADPRFTLDVRLAQSFEGLAERRDGKASIGNSVLFAHVNLQDAESGAALASYSMRSSVTFRFLGPGYGSVAMERDAEAKAVSDLAERVAAQAAAVIAGHKAGPGTTSFAPHVDER
ncbi:hypothetical protein [Magnetospirillum sp. UT-4]|uniref:hypothetical protein n=1 Tax=Magnetospirillum sp. UT-4 TaxID=2681467 RepID=UPI00137C75E9|nr:hypothetical protein [Magnetospirillum sp. UT-4]CAA7621854.1 conserved exported hypothetical protein [Magnetospirillum sp. UT-4]